jgi:hypothetical protein
MDFALPVFVWLVPFLSTKTGSALWVNSACFARFWQVNKSA